MYFVFTRYYSSVAPSYPLETIFIAELAPVFLIETKQMDVPCFTCGGTLMMGASLKTNAINWSRNFFKKICRLIELISSLIYQSFCDGQYPSDTSICCWKSLQRSCGLKGWCHCCVFDCVVLFLTPFCFHLQKSSTPPFKSLQLLQVNPCIAWNWFYSFSGVLFSLIHFASTWYLLLLWM